MRLTLLRVDSTWLGLITSLSPDHADRASHAIAEAIVGDLELVARNAVNSSSTRLLVSWGTHMSDCSALLRKHVLPRLSNPA
jgi:hypothetical protein